MKITNNLTRNIDFVVPGKAKNGVPPTVGIPAGETMDVDIKADDVLLRGMILAGAVTVSDAIAEKVIAEEAPPAIPAKGR